MVNVTRFCFCGVHFLFIYVNNFLQYETLYSCVEAIKVLLQVPNAGFIKSAGDAEFNLNLMQLFSAFGST